MQQIYITELDCTVRVLGYGHVKTAPHVGDFGEGFYFRDDNNCSVENSAEPHSPHSFVTKRIHSAAEGGRQRQRTKNVKRQRREEADEEEWREKQNELLRFPCLQHTSAK